MRSAAIAIAEYLLGFLALAYFAYLAFAGGPSTEDRLISAFKAASIVAVLEMSVMFSRGKPANRLIVGANIWLIAGGLAAYLHQWWWLRGYQQLGEASLFLCIAAVGLVSTALSRSGFVAANGPRRTIVSASLLLLAAVVLALLTSIYYRGNVKLAAVIPIITLSWLNRLLRRKIESGA